MYRSIYIYITTQLMTMMISTINEVYISSLPLITTNLLGGLEHDFYCPFHIIYGMSSFPLTSIFFKMIKTTNQVVYHH